jgi:hypothetical protein
MNRVKFTVEWDKLKEPRFTTIRSYRPDKLAYYESRVGHEFTVLKVPTEWSYRGYKLGTATLRPARVVKPAELPAAELLHDVAHGGRPDQGWLERLVAMPSAILLKFENHTGLLHEQGSR